MNNVVLRENTKIVDNKSFYYSKGFITLYLIMIIWSLPVGIFFAIPFFNYIGFQKIAITLTLAMIYLSPYFKIFDFPVGKKYLILFLLGFSFSVLIAFIENGIAKHLAKAELYNTLEPISVAKGVFIFIMIIVFYRSYSSFLSLIKTIVISAIIIGLMTIFNVDDYFINLFGGVAEEDNFRGDIYQTVVKVRMTFSTMNDGNFGSIMGGCVILALFCYNKYSKKIFLFAVVLFGLLVVMTLARSNFLKLFIVVFIFYSVKNKFKLRLFWIIFLLLIIVYAIVGFTDYGQIFLSQFSEAYGNIDQVIRGKTDLHVMDNFTWRIISAIATLPTTMGGWLIGTGGVQSGITGRVESVSHIEMINWLSQYGLLTFIPFIAYQVSLFRYFFKSGKINPDSFLSKDLTLIKATAAALFVQLWLTILNNPVFLMLYVWLGILTVMGLCYKDILKVAQRRI